MLRLHRPDSGARVRLELAALERLADAGLPVPRPLRTADGATLDESPGRAGVAPVVRRRRVAGSLRARARVRAQHRRAARAHRPRARQMPGGRDAIAHDITDLASARDRLATCRKIAGFPWQRVEDALEDAARAVGDLARAAAPGDPRRRLAQQHHLRRSALRADRLRRRRRRAAHRGRGDRARAARDRGRAAAAGDLVGAVGGLRRHRRPQRRRARRGAAAGQATLREVDRRSRLARAVGPPSSRPPRAGGAGHRGPARARLGAATVCRWTPVPVRGAA